MHRPAVLRIPHYWSSQGLRAVDAQLRVARWIESERRKMSGEDGVKKYERRGRDREEREERYRRERRNMNDREREEKDGEDGAKKYERGERDREEK